MRRSEALAPLREPAFRYQYLASATSFIGTWLSPVALSWGVLQATGSTSTLGVVLAAAIVPQVLFMLLGGVWADRLQRQRVMLAADLLRAGTQGTLGVLLLTGHVDVWSFAVLQFVTGTATAFFQPASTGLTAVTVRPEFLQQANALLSLTGNASGMFGPLVAGVLVATAGAGWALIVDALTFLGSAYFLSRLRLPDLAPRERQDLVRELAVSFRAVAGAPWIWTSIFGFMIQSLALGVLLILGPALLLEYENGAIGWGAIIAATFVGGLLGDVLALRVRPVRLILAAQLILFLEVPLYVAFAVPAAPLVIVATGLLAGLSGTFCNSLWFTALQQHVPTDMLSRVSAFDHMGSSALRPIGYLAAPGAAALVGTSGAFLLCGSMLAAARAMSLVFRSVWNLRRLDELSNV